MQLRKRRVLYAPHVHQGSSQTNESVKDSTTIGQAISKSRIAIWNCSTQILLTTHTLSLLGLDALQQLFVEATCGFLLSPEAVFSGLPRRRM